VNELHIQVCCDILTGVCEGARGSFDDADVQIASVLVAADIGVKVGRARDLQADHGGGCGAHRVRVNLLLRGNLRDRRALFILLVLAVAEQKTSQSS
jgi:hypothetical protein